MNKNRLFNTLTEHKRNQPLYGDSKQSQLNIEKNKLSHYKISQRLQPERDLITQNDKQLSYNSKSQEPLLANQQPFNKRQTAKIFYNNNQMQVKSPKNISPFNNYKNKGIDSRQYIVQQEVCGRGIILGPNQLQQFNNSGILQIKEKQNPDTNSLLEQRYSVIMEQSKEIRNSTLTVIQKLYALSQCRRHVDENYQFYVRQPEGFQELCKNYGIRQSGVKSRLKQLCRGYQPVRGDGNCFYTAFGYQFLQLLLLKFDHFQYNQFIQLAMNNNIRFRIAYEGFNINNEEIEKQLKQEFLFRLSELRNINISQREETLYEQFTSYMGLADGEGFLYGISTIFFRNFADYCVGFSEMKEVLYDRQNLLIWETECNSNEIVIEALAKKLQLHIQLIFFDNNDFNLQEYGGQNSERRIVLLIRPGHYNIGLT